MEYHDSEPAVVQESVRSAEAGPQLPWYEWYPSDCAGNFIVQSMTVAQELAYRRLLDAAWTMRCPCFLPNDPELLSGIARMSVLQWGSDGRIVLKMFSLTEDGEYLFHPKQLNIYRRSRKVWEARHKGGRARAQQQQSSSTPEANPAAVLSITTTTTTVKEEIDKRPPVEFPEDTNAFDDDNLLRLAKTHPRAAQYRAPSDLPYDLRVAMVGAIKHEASTQQITRTEALAYLVSRGLIYTAYVSKWPKSERKFASNPVEWFTKHLYLEGQEDTWERNANEGQRTHSTVVQPIRNAAAARFNANMAETLRAVQKYGDQQEAGNQHGDRPIVDAD